MLDNNPADNNDTDPVINSHIELISEQLSFTDKMSLADKMQLVRDIWLAGLGAYSNSLTGQRMSGEKSSIFFEQLLSRGKQIEYDYALSTHSQHVSLPGLDKFAVPPRCVQQEQAKISQLQAKIEVLSKTLDQAQNN